MNGTPSFTSQSALFDARHPSDPFPPGEPHSCQYTAEAGTCRKCGARSPSQDIPSGNARVADGHNATARGLLAFSQLGTY